MRGTITFLLDVKRRLALHLKDLEGGEKQADQGNGFLRKTVVAKGIMRWLMASRIQSSKTGVAAAREGKEKCEE